ncbi:MAG: hypothetical protein AAB600_01350 [Patescibacteria group bacterium]
MAKHRKTLEQKKIADLRHKFYGLDRVRRGFDSKNIPSLNTKAFSEMKNDSISITSVNKYPYLLHDILKTGILTISIIAVQLILFVILKNKMIVLPMLSY